MQKIKQDLTPYVSVSRTIGFLSGNRGTNYVKGCIAGKKSFGHTGFTGTSLWIDTEKDVGVILLTNRVHPTRTNIEWRSMLPKFHDIVFNEYGDNND